MQYLIFDLFNIFQESTEHTELDVDGSEDSLQNEIELVEIIEDVSEASPGKT